MAVTVSKTFIAGEILTASDLNGEFLNIVNNGQTIGFPRTSEADFNGQEMWLDAAKTSSFTADTDNLLDLKMNSADLFRWDGTVASPVNGMNFVATATGGDAEMLAYGSDTNININLIPKGTGKILLDGNPISDTVLRAVSSNVVARTTKHRMTAIESSHIGEAQSLGF